LGFYEALEKTIKQISCFQDNKTNLMFPSRFSLRR